MQITYKNISLIKTIYYGNFFYGISAVFLCIEAAAQQSLIFNSVSFYAFIFCIVVFYYNLAYRNKQDNDTNDRLHWHYKNANAITFVQILFFSFILLYGIVYLWKYHTNLHILDRYDLLLLTSFPLLGALYYGSEKYNVRQIGWLKPFVIGFIWAGIIHIIPRYETAIKSSMPVHFNQLSIGLLVKNWLYISILCIMFDIKDYATDSNQELKTFVVRYGLRKTVVSIIIPLTLISLALLIGFALSMHFLWLRILLNSIPFIVLILVAFSLSKRRSILYYLTIIDGLMLLKAICGIVGMYIK